MLASAAANGGSAAGAIGRVARQPPGTATRQVSVSGYKSPTRGPLICLTPVYLSDESPGTEPTHGAGNGAVATCVPSGRNT